MAPKISSSAAWLRVGDKRQCPGRKEADKRQRRHEAPGGDDGLGDRHRADREDCFHGQRRFDHVGTPDRMIANARAAWMPAKAEMQRQRSAPLRDGGQDGGEKQEAADLHGRGEERGATQREQPDIPAQRQRSKPHRSAPRHRARPACKTKKAGAADWGFVIAFASTAKPTRSRPLRPSPTMPRSRKCRCRSCDRASVRQTGQTTSARR